MESKKFKIATLGCRTNQYESQGFRDQLLQMGFQEASENEQAEICIVNTCTVTESADSSSRNQIRNLIKENQGTKLIVTGCLAERKPQFISEIEGVSHVISNQEKENLIQKIFPEENVPEFSIRNFENHTRAFVKVQDGCNSFCTYCIIPYVRGRSRSRNVPEILNEIENLVQNGYKEVVITGINVGDFDGGDVNHPQKLSDLIKAVDEISGLERIRVSSIDPDEVDEELAETILKGKKTCHSMHIVLQSGSNLILKRMNRKYTRQVFLETIHKLKALDPDFTFTTDVIVGFPGETEQDFLETIDLMREVQFAKVHMFPYSPRERTRAALYPNKVSAETIKVRKQQVLRESEHIAYQLRNHFIGRTMKVLTENMDGEMISGHTENFLEVQFPKMHVNPNEIVEVEILSNGPKMLLGKLVKR